MDIRNLASLTLTAALFGSFPLVTNADMTPDAVTPPSGNEIAMKTVGVGEITYACEMKDGDYAWVFKGPDAKLNDSDGNQVGSYYGPPATWESSDGSKITGTQIGTADGGEGNIPLQLVEANPAEGEGHMSGVTYVQRLETRGGVAPASSCSADNAGDSEVVEYQANYNFFKAS
ncbi:DUF3455 domain-containing protein [Salinicola rhizosphaerae]|uniref:DUF3455 domain-containing protein n=1 Tax=Salinicola rhizosphaerae TaxID=1443141 RepID=A0ABQ3E697_9GAMM|nr:DUF3455 domain-containing protein [Salinicola rhizosphaerae]GHB27522.1 hypothetical protein GCM10009038_27730 [Salinicola rhizosphaerae]